MKNSHSKCHVSGIVALHLPRHAGDDGAAVQPVALGEEAPVLPLARPLVFGLGSLRDGWAQSLQQVDQCDW